MMRRRRLILLASFVFLLGLHASKIVNASANHATGIANQPLYGADDEGVQQDVYNAGEDFYIWTTTESKIA